MISLSKLAAMNIGKKIGIKWENVPFTIKDFKQGLKVEFEHGSKDPETDVTHDDPVKTGKIAWAHLKEDPKYYQKLKKVEKK